MAATRTRAKAHRRRQRRVDRPRRDSDRCAPGTVVVRACVRARVCVAAAGHAPAHCHRLAWPPPPAPAVASRARRARHTPPVCVDAIAESGGEEEEGGGREQGTGREEGGGGAPQRTHIQARSHSRLATLKNQHQPPDREPRNCHVAAADGLPARARDGGQDPGGRAGERRQPLCVARGGRFRVWLGRAAS